MRHLTCAAVMGAIVATMLIPASASAQRTPPICKVRPDAPICKRVEQKQEQRERAKGNQPNRGISAACRVASNRYSSAVKTQTAARRKQASAKKALKNAKGKKAKAKKAKALGKAKAKYKKAKKNAASRRKAKTTACS